MKFFQKKKKIVERYEIILAGLGGQGLILAGVMLSAASAIFDKKYVVQTQSYAPLARGAPSRSEVIISTEPIDFPEVIKADLLVALSQDAYNKFKNKVKSNGIIIVDSKLVSYPHRKNEQIIGFPFTQTAKEKTKRALTASTLVLGVISTLTGIVSTSALRKSVKDRVPPGTEKVNIKALKIGFDLGKKLTF